jgi:RHS repeat-associated protein
MIEEHDQTGHLTKYAYDAVGRMSLKVDAKGDTSRFIYTRKGQVKEIHYQDGIVETFQYDGLGKKVSEGNGLISYSYRYDNVGRLIEFHNHALAKSLKYEYDLAGNKTAQINWEGERAEYRYDAVNRLAQIKDVNGGVTRFEYDKMGNRTKLLYPNGVYTAYSYDSSYRLLAIAHFKSDNSLLAGFNYTYDKVGNRKTMADARGTHTYHYDDLYRLTQVDYPEGRTQRWTYDGTGQRLTEIEAIPSNSPDTTIYHYTKDRLDSTTGAVSKSYRYDANGSMVQSGMETFRYDAKMRLRQVQAVGQPLNIFTYDPMGLRVQSISSEGKIQYLIDPSSNLGQFNTMSVSAEYKNGVKSREFGLGTKPDEVIWEENGDGIFYLLYDGLGSVVALTNSTGNSVGSLSYDAFGKTFNQSGVSARYGYTGRPIDHDVGLQYNRSRFYDPTVARWEKYDEFRGRLEDPKSLNRYIYAAQNPTNFSDPSGYFFAIVFPFIAAALLEGIVIAVGIAILLYFAALIYIRVAEIVLSMTTAIYREVENEYNDLAKSLIGSPSLPPNIDPRNICQILKWLWERELSSCGNDKKQRSIIDRKFVTAEKAAGCRNAQKRGSN